MKIYEIIINNTPWGVLNGQNYTIHFTDFETAVEWAMYYNVEYITLKNDNETTKIILKRG